MNLYEGMFILDPHLNDQEVKDLVSDIEEEIKKLNGQIVESHNLGKKRLAYAINKQVEGYYLSLYFKAETSAIDKLNNKYRLKERIFRNLILGTTEDLKKETIGYLELVGSRSE